MPLECPDCLLAHDYRLACIEDLKMIRRLRARIRQQEDELRALRAITRPDYTPTESASVPAIITTLCDHSGGICNACAPRR